MSKQIKTVKKDSRAIRGIRFGFTVLMLVGTIWLISGSVQELFAGYQLNKELDTARQELENVQQQQEELTNEKAMLQDPGYVQNYARGAHLLSSSEEQVFILTEE